MGLDSKTDRDISVSGEEINGIRKTAMITIVFCAFTLEALINYYAMTFTSEKFFADHDKLSPPKKWIIIPKSAVNKQIPADGEAYRDLKWLFELRNKLVHSRGKKMTLREMMQEDYFTQIALGAAMDAKRAIDTVEKTVNALKEIDSRIDTDWLTKV